MEIFKNKEQVVSSTELLGKSTVDMLFQVHQDALWVLENMGVACVYPEIVEAFRNAESDGKAINYENRIYITGDLVHECLRTVPGQSEFFVPRNSFFIGGRAAYIYDDSSGKGGVLPTLHHVERIAKIAEANDIVAGMAPGVYLKDELAQINTMADHCSKPLLVPITSNGTLERVKELYKDRGKVMVTFCLTHHPLQVNENFSDIFVKVVRSGLPVFLAALPMAGMSAPYCYNGVLTITHAEVLFAICAAQLLKAGSICIHAGLPSVADHRYDYNPNYGLMSHNLLNILMAHLNSMLDLPTIQSGCTTNEEHVTERALEDARLGLALFKRYEFHMLRHAFGFLRGMLEFSIGKLEKVIKIAEEVTMDDAPEVIMPSYDERGMESIRQYGLSLYKDDPLTTANIGKIFVN
jgi:trimethylamine:corrinoid methyltransferase-like protein